MTIPSLDREERGVYEYLLATRGGGGAGGESPTLAKMAQQMVARDREARSGGPTPKDVLEEGVGYIGALEFLDLKRRLLNGGLQRMLDLALIGGWKTKVGGVTMILTGAAAILTALACMTTALIGGHFLADVNGCWEQFLAGAASIGLGYSALGIGHKLDKQLAASTAAKS